MLNPGDVLEGRYRIEDLLGQGGMGAIYKATDLRLGRVCAVKETTLTFADAGRMFEHEARLLALLRHPALPNVSDHFVAPNGQFLVMEFIPGDDLETLLARRGAPFEIADVLRWADQLLDALEYLHAQQPPVIHRDIKPQNIKLTPDGRVMLLDFGISKGNVMDMTVASQSVAAYTPCYAPLEQIQRNAPTDARADLYAFAATLYTLLTNTQPADALARAGARITGAPDPLPPASQLNPAVPAWLDALLARALELDPARRPGSASELRAALRSQAQMPDGAFFAAAPRQQADAALQPLPQTIPVRAPTTVKLSQPPAGRRGLLAGGLLALLAFVALLGAWQAGLFGGAEEARSPTRQPVGTPSDREVPMAANSITLRPEEVRQLERQGNRIFNGARLIDDGASLLALTTTGWELYRTRDGELVDSYEQDGYGAIGANADASLWVSGTPTDTTVLLREREGNQVRAALAGHEGSVEAVLFSPDSQYLLTADAFGTVIVWSSADGTQLASADGMDALPVSGAAWAPDSRSFAVAQVLGDLWVYRLDAMDQPARYDLADSTNSLSFSPDGSTLIGLDDAALRFFSTDPLTQTRELPLDPAKKIFTVDYSPSAEQLLVSYASGQIELLDSQTGALIANVIGVGEPAFIGFTADGQQALVEPLDLGGIMLVGFDGEIRALVDGFGARIEHVAIAPDGAQYAVAGQQVEEIEIYSRGGDKLRTLKSDAAVTGLFYADGETLVSVGEDHALVLWDVRTGQKRDTLRGHQDEIVWARAVKQGSLIYSFDTKDNLFAWETATGLQKDSVELPGVAALDVSSDGTEAVFVDSLGDGVVRWSIAEQREREKLALAELGVLVVPMLNPAAPQLALINAKEEGRIQLLGLDGTIGEAFQAHRAVSGFGALTGAGFSDDGRLLITSSRDQSLVLWDATTGKELRRLVGHGAEVMDFDLTPDGQTLISVGRDGHVRLWGLGE